MQTNQTATVDELIAAFNTLLKAFGMAELPPDTNPSNVGDRLKVLLAQFDQPSNNQTYLNGIGEVTLPAGVEMANKLRHVSNAERQRQQIAARVARQRGIPFADALKFVPQ